MQGLSIKYCNCILSVYLPYMHFSIIVDQGALRSSIENTAKLVNGLKAFNWTKLRSSIQKA